MYRPFRTGDEVSLPILVWRVYRRCRDSSSDLTKLSPQVSSLYTALKEAEDHIADGSLNAARQNQFFAICQGCQGVLRDLDGLLKRYETLPVKTQRTLDRMDWCLRDISELGPRLVSNTSILNSFNSKLATFSRTRIDTALNKFIVDVCSGQSTAQTVRSLDIQDTQAWQTFCKAIPIELKAYGLPLKAFHEKRSQITERIRNLLLSDELGDDFEIVENHQPGLNLDSAQFSSLLTESTEWLAWIRENDDDPSSPSADSSSDESADDDIPPQYEKRKETLAQLASEAAEFRLENRLKTHKEHEPEKPWIMRINDFRHSSWPEMTQEIFSVPPSAAADKVSNANLSSPVRDQLYMVAKEAAEYVQNRRASQSIPNFKPTCHVSCHVYDSTMEQNKKRTSKTGKPLKTLGIGKSTYTESTFPIQVRYTNSPVDSHFKGLAECLLDSEQVRILGLLRPIFADVSALSRSSLPNYSQLCLQQCLLKPVTPDLSPRPRNWTSVHSQNYLQTRPPWDPWASQGHPALPQPTPGIECQRKILFKLGDLPISKRQCYICANLRSPCERKSVFDLAAQVAAQSEESRLIKEKICATLFRTKNVDWRTLSHDNAPSTSGVSEHGISANTPVHTARGNDTYPQYPEPDITDLVCLTLQEGTCNAELQMAIRRDDVEAIRQVHETLGPAIVNVRFLELIPSAASQGRRASLSLLMTIYAKEVSNSIFYQPWSCEIVKSNQSQILQLLRDHSPIHDEHESAGAIDRLPEGPLDRWQDSALYYLTCVCMISNQSNHLMHRLGDIDKAISFTSSMDSFIVHHYSQMFGDKDFILTAARNGMSDFLELFIKSHEDLVNKFDALGRTPLCIASECGRLQTVKILLSVPSVNPNTPDNRGETPLLKAARWGETGVVRLLLSQRDINVNIKNREGRTALYWARRCRHQTIVKLLQARRDISLEEDDIQGIEIRCP